MAQELKSVYIDRTGDWCRSGNNTGNFYIKSEVDAVLAEKDNEIERLDDLAHAHNIELLRKENLIAEQDAEIRRLQRALWFSRAKAYRYIAELITCFNPDYIRNRRMFTPNNLKQKQMNSLKWARLMLKIESKCRAKAEEYK